MLQYEHIAASLFSHWADQFPLAVTTVYPGMRIDTSGLSEWLEIGVDRWVDALNAAAEPTVELSVAVHIFVRPGVDTSRAYELADAARQTLADQVVTLHDYETMGEPVVGSATLLKPEVEDHTRRDVDASWHRLTHLLLTVAAVAEEA